MGPYRAAICGISSALLGAALFHPLLLVQASEDLPPVAVREQRAYSKKTIRVGGKVVDPLGAGISGATLLLGALSTATDAAGEFVFEKVPRKNALLEVSASGFRTELIPLHLELPTRERALSLDPVILTNLSGVRLLFGGDTSFGRRFLDPTGKTPRDQMPADHPEALIQVSDPIPGSTGVVQYIRPCYQEADFASVNLETAITDNLTTPHPDKEFAFFTLPSSLEALTWLGVDYVALGNNHVYDYLDLGIASAKQHLDASGIPHSGAGMRSAEAFQAYRVTLGGQPYALLSTCSVTGAQTQITYVAGATKGGAADATDTAAFLAAAARELAAEQNLIVQIHGGVEYSYAPSVAHLQRLEGAVGAGAMLVVSHHPHVAQGIGVKDGVYCIHSLGNLAFDQDRIETFLGLLARVDVEGKSVRTLRMLPVYLEDYRPRLISGRLAATFLRRIGESSAGYGALAYPYQAQGWVSSSTGERTPIDRTVQAVVEVPEGGLGWVDLRGYAAPEESLVSARLSGQAQGALGRDLLLHGDFEDYDLDEDRFEALRWNLSTTSKYTKYVSLHKPFRGAACLRSFRSSTSEEDSVVSLNNRVRVRGDAENTPNKSLSLVGYLSGKNAGRIRIVARYYGSDGDLEFGEEDAVLQASGSYKWRPFLADLHMPADDPAAPGDPGTVNARAVRLFLHHSPPRMGIGCAAYDELAIVNWEETFDLGAGHEFQVPHARDFLRVTAAPGTYTLSLAFRSYRPAAAVP